MIFIVEKYYKVSKILIFMDIDRIEKI